MCIRDSSKIELYGPFASVLGYIIHNANKKRLDLKTKNQFFVYRGLKLTKEDLEDYKKDNIVTLKGFTSCSESKDVAMDFALDDMDEP